MIGLLSGVVALAIRPYVIPSTVCGTVRGVLYQPNLLSSDYFVTIDNTTYPVFDDAFDYTMDTAIAGTLQARIGSNVCVTVIDGKIHGVE